MRKVFNLFWIFLFLVGSTVPLLHMNTTEITEQENRTLAELPKIIRKEKLNTNYGKEFESWLGDRFWGRNQLIDARFQTLYKINGRIENEKAFIGDDGWMFQKSKTVNIPSIDKQRKEIEKDAKILKAFADKFKGKNIPIYLVLVPEREVLYQKYWERYYKPKPRLNRAEEMKKQLEDYSNIKIIYPMKEFKEIGQECNIFLKNDNHLTHMGSKLILNSFLKASDIPIKQQWETFPIKRTNNYIEELLKVISPPNTEGGGFYVKSSDKRKRNVVFQDNGGSHWPLFIEYSSSTANIRKRLFVFGGCVGLNSILSYTSFLFQKSYYLRMGSYYKSYHEDEKRDTYFQQIFPKIHSGDVIVLYSESSLDFLSETLDKI